jgi:MFS family permease
MSRRSAAPSDSQQRAAGRERRLLVVVGTVVFVDTMFYAVIAPLLPGLAHDLRLSKLSAGLLTASYAIGTLLGSLPGGILAVRAGPRFTVCAGLAMLAGSTVAFGFLHSAAGLDTARFVEGVGGACSWSGGLAWVVAETPVDRRGAVIGQVLAAGIGGSLVGPAVGTLATATGRPALFTGIAGVAAILIALTRRLPSHELPADQGLFALAGLLRKPGITAAMWLVALPAVVSGMVNVLGPLRLHRLGAGAVVIGATFLVAAAAESAMSPAVGSLSDRRGRLVPLRAGLAAGTVTLLCFTVPSTAATLSLLIVLISAALGAFWAPAIAMVSDAADAHGLNQGLAAALMNLAWAGGQIVGSGAGGAVAKTAGDLLPIATAAGLCALTLAVVARPPAVTATVSPVAGVGPRASPDEP